MPNPNLAGRGLLQSPEEWAARNRALADTLSELVNQNIAPSTCRALDVGCQDGALTDALGAQTNFEWFGVDPAIALPKSSGGGAQLLNGWAHKIPFPDQHFDCVVLANVYEHISPELRTQSLGEIRRVLAAQGILVGQLPNPYFPIESHSRLPFMGWLPMTVQKKYWRLAPVTYKHNFYVVTASDLKIRAEALGFQTVQIRQFNYPRSAIPRSVRWAAGLFDLLNGVIPWSWQFVFRNQL